MPAICAPCTEEINDNYTLRTGDAYLCGPDGVTRSLGNVQLLQFTYTPNSIEHRSGKDGAIDAVIPLTEDYGLVITVDELTPSNVAYLLNQDMVTTVEGCEIPLKRGECAREYSFQFIHTFPCADKTMQIDIWRAIIAPTEVTLEFGETIVNFPITVKAKSCASIHPDNPFGRILFSETCPAS